MLKHAFAGDSDINHVPTRQGDITEIDNILPFQNIRC